MDLNTTSRVQDSGEHTDAGSAKIRRHNPICGNTTSRIFDIAPDSSTTSSSSMLGRHHHH
ncbi:hypothetical protein ACP70R_004057 [Stipagrostis hirtigluma subsp. patula]